MPAQTTKSSNVYFPDGCVVALKASGEATYTDVGVLMSDANATLNWDENAVETANAGTLRKQIKNMTIDGSVTLGNLEPDSLERFGADALTVVDTAGSAISTLPDQTIAADWSDNTMYALDMKTSSTDSTIVRTTAQPTLTSVKLDPDDTDEVLVENTEYVVVANSSSPSGWSIQFISTAMTLGSPKGYAIEIVFGENTPIASSTIYCGTSTLELTAYAMQITHTDDDSKIRRLTLYSVDPNSGGFAFNFKGATSDGIEEMPLTFTAKLDTSLTDGRQLLAFTVEDGAS